MKILKDNQISKTFVNQKILQFIKGMIVLYNGIIFDSSFVYAEVKKKDNQVLKIRDLKNGCSQIDSLRNEYSCHIIHDTFFYWKPTEIEVGDYGTELYISKTGCQFKKEFMIKPKKSEIIFFENCLNKNGKKTTRKIIIDYSDLVLLDSEFLQDDSV